MAGKKGVVPPQFAANASKKKATAKGKGKGKTGSPNNKKMDKPTN